MRVYADRDMLARGITGFSAQSDPPLPLTDVRAFRGHCHAPLAAAFELREWLATHAL